MIVVLAVLALMVALVVARGPQRSPTLDLRAAAGEVAQALRAARARAIATDQPVTFRLDLAAHAYVVGTTPPHALPASLGLVMTSVAGETSANAAGISFAPDGSSSGGALDLVLGARRAHVAVDWLTGRVTVAEAAADAG
jgi:general secretion pathway protein H